MFYLNLIIFTKYVIGPHKNSWRAASSHLVGITDIEGGEAMSQVVSFIEHGVLEKAFDSFTARLEVFLVRNQQHFKQRNFNS